MSVSPSSTPSPLCSPSEPLRPTRVLLLLSTQNAPLSEPPVGVPAAATIRANIGHVLAKARSVPPAQRPRIIHVRNNGDAGDPDEPHTRGWQLHFPPAEDEFVVDKSKNNAFAGTRLAQLVPKDAEIVVVGMQSDFCVRATCSAALGRGNEVLLIRGAHGTYDRLEVFAGGGITPASKIEAEIEAELEEAGVVVLQMEDVPGIFTDR
ncbi:Isochorismatase hydrolase [Gloeophyllum trabeum ATCC 11539]|uniref:Isochorismatase hydrolase n=1 Tax=Gloeophyllum trabeum (strain ATCC 11539 / FP-39264 / Madison 617) TaxID=670483 RepID=S7RHZ4_GLOTA|nr:Isochorismatase hydrolase [Gloeophyllum trabeum ATCC 11539]EPQ53905.1 Isochorismatase hydrolase [Gloeophyllum trabeum ATCC 11539]